MENYREWCTWHRTWLDAVSPSSRTSATWDAWRRPAPTQHIDYLACYNLEDGTGAWLHTQTAWFLPVSTVLTVWYLYHYFPHHIISLPVQHQCSSEIVSGEILLSCTPCLSYTSFLLLPSVNQQVVWVLLIQKHVGKIMTDILQLKQCEALNSRSVIKPRLYI